MSALWELVWGKPEVDPTALALAIEKELDGEEANGLDFRTCLLVRDSTDALEHYWGTQRLEKWLNHSRVSEKIKAIRKQNLGEPGFPSLKEQLMDRTAPETVKEYFRELGQSIEKSTRLEVGGSIALILSGYLSRSTEDIDVVDEVPEELRKRYDLLENLQKRYRLLVAHFQSHYLPSGWQDRLEYQGRFGLLDIYTIDVYDLFLCKLFSNRSKDLDDLRALKTKIDRQRLEKQLQATSDKLIKEKDLKSNAEKNWYILFGEDLPQSANP
jgi:hypothetical protein